MTDAEKQAVIEKAARAMFESREPVQPWAALTTEAQEPWTSEAEVALTAVDHFALRARLDALVEAAEAAAVLIEILDAQLETMRLDYPSLTKHGQRRGESADDYSSRLENDERRAETEAQLCDAARALRAALTAAKGE